MSDITQNIAEITGIASEDILELSEDLIIITSAMSAEMESQVRGICGRVRVQFTKRTTSHHWRPQVRGSEPMPTESVPRPAHREPGERGGAGRIPWRKLDTNHVSKIASLVRSSEAPLGADAVLVLLALFCHTSRNPECFPSTSTLCKITKMSRSHAFQQLKKLEQLRLIERRRTGRDNRYRIPALPPD